MAYLLEYEASEPIGRGALVRLLEAWTPPFPGFCLYYLSRRQARPILSAFVDHLRRSASARSSG